MSPILQIRKLRLRGIKQYVQIRKPNLSLHLALLAACFPLLKASFQTRPQLCFQPTLGQSHLWKHVSQLDFNRVPPVAQTHHGDINQGC